MKKKNRVDPTPTLWDTPCGDLMKWLFIEFPEFTEVWRDYFVTDKAQAEFQAYLAKNPETGDVIPGCGGIRKVRWLDSRRSKGRRGGLRVIYLYIPEANVIVLADVYDKSEAEDLTAGEKKAIAQAAKVIKSQLLARFRKERSK